MRYLLLLLLLYGCGGGGGSSGGSVSNQETLLPRAIDFGYFGTGDNQLAATAAHVSFVHVPDWGPASAKEAIKQRIIAQMQEARARGVDRFVLSTGFLTFDGCTWLGSAELVAFKAQLAALDLARSVFMLYPKDEPDVAGCSGAIMAQAFMETRAAWGSNVRIGVFYGPNGATPGIDQATDAGRDNYGHGPQALNLRADQHLMLIAGGANPYREDAQPYVDYAESHANVSAVWAFLFIPYTDPDGHPQQGIGSNGLLPAYASAGCQLTLQCPHAGP